MIMHGNGPMSHKIIGFAKIVGTEEYIAYPNSSEDIKEKIKKCWNNRDQIRTHLKIKIPKVKQLARDSFDAVKDGMKEE